MAENEVIKNIKPLYSGFFSNPSQISWYRLEEVSNPTQTSFYITQPLEIRSVESDESDYTICSEILNLTKIN